MAATDNKKLSKFLSYVLRHRPDEIGLSLDANGWADIDELLRLSATASMHMNRQDLLGIVQSNDKQRFAISDDGTKVRANQGHSIPVDLALSPATPPEFLYHGTTTRFSETIRVEGLKPMSRQHVHLSLDETTANKVGQRHGRPIILKIRTGEMHRDGCVFFVSQNGVWLTDRVHAQYIDFATASASA